MLDANGNATDYVFDSSGNVLSKTQHLDAQTPVTWSYTYNSFNQVLTATDPLGVVTKNEYDAKGNLTCTSPERRLHHLLERGGDGYPSDLDGSHARKSLNLLDNSF